MAVDDARHDVLAGAVDDARVCGCVETLSDGRDLAVAQKHVCVLERAARDGQDCGVADQRLGRCFLRTRDADGQRRDDGDEKEFGDEWFHCLVSGASFTSNSRPSIKTCVTWLFLSNKSPRTIVRFAIFPASI